MEARQYAEHEGEFGEPRLTEIECPKCKLRTVAVRAWESDCGGYVDHKYECTACGHGWWVDGPDA